MDLWSDLLFLNSSGFKPGGLGRYSENRPRGNAKQWTNPVSDEKLYAIFCRFKFGFVLKPDGIFLLWRRNLGALLQSLQPTRGDAPSCESIVRNEMKGYGIKTIFSESQPHRGGSMVEIDFRFPNIVRGKILNNVVIVSRTKYRHIPF